MAHRVEIEHDFDRQPGTDAFGSQIVRFILGHDTVDDTVFFMSVSLTTAANDGVYDLRFGIEERQADQPDWVVGTDYSIEYSKRVIPGEYRPVVLQYILEALRSIVGTCTPIKVTMQSFYSNLPDKAMVKYGRICDLMVECGLEVTIYERDGTNGKHYWLFERVIEQ